MEDMCTSLSIHKNETPCQAICNKLQVNDFPEDLRCIRWLKLQGLNWKASNQKYSYIAQRART